MKKNDIFFICISNIWLYNKMKDKMKLEQSGNINTDKLLEQQQLKIDKNKNLGPTYSKNKIDDRQTRIAEKTESQSKLLDNFLKKNSKKNFL